jgi:hypothetical protein
MQFHTLWHFSWQVVSCWSKSNWKTAAYQCSYINKLSCTVSLHPCKKSYAPRTVDPSNLKLVKDGDNLYSSELFIHAEGIIVFSWPKVCIKSFPRTQCSYRLMLSVRLGLLLDEPTPSFVGHMIWSPSTLVSPPTSLFQQRLLLFWTIGRQCTLLKENQCL